MSSEGLRCGSLVLSGMWVMGSCGVDEEVKIIGDWAASTRGGRADAVKVLGSTWRIARCA